ncbi:MAG TPA: ABC transporter ATP-binding protein [Methanospirillum sp.]|uniref:ABC transporter ATP-binding protein n=1 Tax=Methanospirillum sp. TaxID=45200 RepID=UPI002D0E46B1|nr:ABC transporter ATP-binding protein [Methanospirillum sp.]HOJ97876.1 ABC transporter ATP-binding protein [Methanospirillum sp.]HOL41629.1 ABC transporter ATP-binding protein [Methanospirillum sp.]HPP77139.1 ABC transporter ATP-binding protein [Methanospirillum sp.]
MTLTIDRLNVWYGSVQILYDICFSIRDGEILCVIGPNGSGKSTLIKTLAGIIEPKSGIISMNGVELSQYSRNEVAKKIGYVPQDFQYLSSSTVLEAVILGRRPHVQWTLKPQDLEIVDTAMEMLNITSMAEKMLTELSGGERQRVFIARAIAQKPEYYLFDEPTSALDIRHQIDVFSMIRTITRSGKGSVFVAVHDLNFAYHYADRVILMDKGRIIAQGTPDEVMTRDHIISVYDVPMQFITTDAGQYVVPDWIQAEKTEQYHQGEQ